ncbi:hypothetical protein DM02DRAFT_407042 [Periconia macrospinosa]|uniref:Uncharacterized protein n=1 Tax=Periconia macrospinosa TaxID=97972 RepID=A0A2V1EAR4_9PLEO|nr:hypothetical protein DM02DRAFT_407042 [Periconia macrospinosa]
MMKACCWRPSVADYSIHTASWVSNMTCMSVKCENPNARQKILRLNVYAESDGRTHTTTNKYTCSQQWFRILKCTRLESCAAECTSRKVRNICPPIFLYHDSPSTRMPYFVCMTLFPPCANASAARGPTSITARTKMREGWGGWRRAETRKAPN